MLSQVDKPFGDGKAELQQQAANVVGERRSLLDDQFSLSLDRLHGLLLDTFHWCDLNVGPICRLGNCQCIIFVGFMALSEGYYSYGWYYLYLMAAAGSDPSPVVSSGAGLKRNQPWFLLGKKLSELQSCKFLVCNLLIGRCND